MCFDRDDYEILLSRKMILFSKLRNCNRLKLSIFSKDDDLDILVRFCYILGEPLWGKQSYLFSK